MQRIETSTKEAPEVGSQSDGPTEPGISFNCLDPSVGESRVIPYLVGDMTRTEGRDFAAHVTECRHCLKEVVLWRLAEVIVEHEDSGDLLDETVVKELCQQSPPLFPFETRDDSGVALG